MGKLTLANSTLDNQVLWAELGARLTKLSQAGTSSTLKSQQLCCCATW